jgi:hypothetical protein
MDDIAPLSPVNFFQFQIDCHRLEKSLSTLSQDKLKTYFLPDLSPFCAEHPFADVFAGWSLDGFEVYISVLQPFQKCTFPDVTRGDSFELFLDARDVKTSGFNTRFCHHFYFLPESIEGQSTGEITRFRTEDVHELCDPRALKINTTFKKSGYAMHIFIPAHCIYGYDPEQFDRLGFSYRINRPEGHSQHFSASTEEYQIEQQPSLWSSMRLVK